MTQAFNLSQLANNLNSSGQLDATDGLINAVPIANGGTGASNAADARANLGVASANSSVPSGGIIMWSGAVASIPAGWFLCNGSNGTPDLRDRFVIGAGNSYAVGVSGGTKDAIVVAHTHSTSVSDPGHYHGGIPTSSNDIGNNAPSYREGASPAGYGTTTSANTGISVSVASSGSSGTNANLPPYYSLCFIMKS